MWILSHRGYWAKLDEKNTLSAFHRSFDMSFGTETDIRDCCGDLVISHDMPIDCKQALTLNDFLKIYNNCNLPLALNIKSDGLAPTLKKIMQKEKIVDWFVFDMSIPDMKSYLREEMPVFARMSEVERDPVWIDEVAGIWLDSFQETWYDLDLITTLLRKNLRVCIVSPELHGQEHISLWTMLRSLKDTKNLMLCTDFPEDAKKFFGAQ